jgi:large subunit ribosomal protein L25
VADLTGLEIGDTVRWSDLNAPAGVEPVIKGRDFTIATVAGSAASASAEAAANAAG